MDWRADPVGQENVHVPLHSHRLSGASFWELGGQAELPPCPPQPGVRSWDIDPRVCSLDEQLKIFVSRHSATFSSIVKGQRSLHHRGDTLETLVLLNPSDKSLCDELRNLLLDPAPHKLLVLAGPCLEETGELLLQTGGFSPHHFLQVLGDKEIHDTLASSPPPADLPTLTITCPTFGDWARLAPDVPNLQGPLRLQLRLNPPVRLPAAEGLREFLEYVAESLELPSPFELLEPPSSGGFLRLPRPCCYIFPGGLGDAAFFAVNGFTMLVNGGSNPKSSFWKLVRHLDRVDAVLVTHAGADSLPGLNSLLRRKLAERHEVATAGGGSWDDRLRRLISPNLGVVFLNAREAVSRLMRGEDEAELALSLLTQLGITPLPLSRGPLPAKPTVLLEKMGVGRLDMYVLHPPSSGSDRTLASVCALLVWHPAGPADKVVRVLFPGCTPPARLLDGLVRLQHLGFLQEPVVTPQDLEGPRRAESKESVGSRDSSKRESRTGTAPRPGQERPGAARKEPVRAEPPRKTEKETRPSREVKKDPKPVAPRAQPREVRRTANAAASLKKAGTQGAPKARRAPAVPQAGAVPVENGPCSPPSPSAAARGSPAPQLVATPSLGLRNLLLDPAPHKLLVLAGPCLEETGELLLQTGGFSPHHFLQVLGDKEGSGQGCWCPELGTLVTLQIPSDTPWGPRPELGSLSDPRCPGAPGRLPVAGSSCVCRSGNHLLAWCCGQGPHLGTLRALGLIPPQSPEFATDLSLLPTGAAGSRPGRPATPPGSPVYLDLAYLPSGSSARLVDEEFFRRVRALCYVISGQDQRKEEGMRAVLDALLASKQQWDRDLQVTLIPTFDSVAMHKWYEETHARHQALGITVLGSNSMVSMQDEAFPACKVEF
ncbi:microtubule-associated protein 1S [Marmota marmota marmota]|uniref:microtubule-associated protein 1S n=1 Tax=Marmota marmota marmota TaxID=9994 RepID=UPI002092A4D5|nr:microtubule-associated protein 1S [Marmota marmota marmota]